MPIIDRSEVENEYRFRLKIAVRSRAVYMTMCKTVWMPFIPVKNMPITEKGYNLGQLWSLTFDVSEMEWQGFIMAIIPREDDDKLFRMHEILRMCGWSLIDLDIMELDKNLKGDAKYEEPYKKHLDDARTYFAKYDVDLDDWANAPKEKTDE